MAEFNFIKNKANIAVESFFSKLFEIRNTLYLSHLRQYDAKLSTHLALDDAQEGVNKNTDRLIELYFGLYGPFDFKSPECSSSKELISYTETAYNYVKSNRHIFVDSALLQICDDIQEVLGVLLYKLKYVK